MLWSSSLLLLSSAYTVVIVMFCLPSGIPLGLGQTSVCAYLLDLMGFVDVETDGKDTPLMLAAWQGHLETCRFLATQRAEPRCVESIVESIWNRRDRPMRNNNNNKVYIVLSFLMFTVILYIYCSLMSLIYYIYRIYNIYIYGVCVFDHL